MTLQSLPPQTAEIFEILSKGQFISSNGDDRTRLLYRIIDEGDAYPALRTYFAAIDLELEQGNEYYHFSRRDSKADIERKVEAAFKWIDILDFFKAFDASFGAGYRFTIHDVVTRAAVDAPLKMKLEGLKKYAAGKERHADILGKVIELLERDSFVMLEGEITGTYKVLTAFRYLEELVLAINITQDEPDATPE